ncbi:MAG: hypothetical protein ACI4HO_07930 [Ruminococcus sp.]
MSENKKLKRDLEKLRKDAENLTKNAQENAVEYINSIADKMQKFTAEKIEIAEEKAINLINDSKTDKKEKSPSIK